MEECPAALVGCLSRIGFGDYHFLHKSTGLSLHRMCYLMPKMQRIRVFESDRERQLGTLKGNNLKCVEKKNFYTHSVC